MLNFCEAGLFPKRKKWRMPVSPNDNPISESSPRNSCTLSPIVNAPFVMGKLSGVNFTFQSGLLYSTSPAEFRLTSSFREGWGKRGSCFSVTVDRGRSGAPYKVVTHGLSNLKLGNFAMKLGNTGS